MAIMLHNCYEKIKLQKMGHEFVSGSSLSSQLHIIYWVSLPHIVSNPNEIKSIVASMYKQGK